MNDREIPSTDARLEVVYGIIPLCKEETITGLDKFRSLSESRGEIVEAIKFVVDQRMVNGEYKTDAKGHFSFSVSALTSAGHHRLDVDEGGRDDDD